MNYTEKRIKTAYILEAGIAWERSVLVVRITIMLLDLYRLVVRKFPNVGRDVRFLFACLGLCLATLLYGLYARSRRHKLFQLVSMTTNWACPRLYTDYSETFRQKSYTLTVGDVRLYYGFGL